MVASKGDESEKTDLNSPSAVNKRLNLGSCPISWICASVSKEGKFCKWRDCQRLTHSPPRQCAEPLIRMLDLA